MDHRKSPNSRRSKRQSKIAEENYWDCSVCTYRNTAEAFKCLMCDVRKGTSTRKPRINPQLVAQQVAQQYPQPPPKVKKERETSRDLGIDNSSNSSSQLSQLPVTPSPKPEKKTSSSSDTSSHTTERRTSSRPKLKNVDRTNASHEAVTVNNVTVIITEFQPKRRTSLDQSHSSSSSSGAENSHQSDSTNRTESRTNGDLHYSDSRSS